MTLILKRILFFFPFLQLFLLMVLPFYQHPVADDFAGFYIASKIGIGGAIRSYLENGTGRFFVVSVFILICSSRFLLDRYFIIPLLFFIITYVNIFYFIRETWKIFFTRKPTLPHLHWLTAACIILFLTSIEEVSTFFIWITTCCIFLASFNLLLFYMRWVFRFNFNEQQRNAKWLYLLLTVCVILLTGCEETTLYFSFAVNAFIFYAKPAQKKLYSFPAFLLVLQLACIAIVFFLPGNRMRTHDFSPLQPVYFSLYSAFYQTVYIFYKILSNPLLWLFAIGCVLAYPFLHERFQKKISTVKTTYLALLFLVAGLVYFLCFFIRHFGDRVLPEYANNLVICYVIIIFLALVISKSYQFNTMPLLQSGIFKKQGAGIIYLSCIFLFVFSGFNEGLIQSLVTAPAHDRVLNDRKSMIAEAKLAGKTSVSFNSYQDACVQVLSASYGKKVALFVKNSFHFPPKYICTRNLAMVDFSYAAYYGIDTIYMAGKTVVSWDKAGIPLWNVK